MKINNRRYTGSKYKLMPWIKNLIIENCPQHDSLFDVFGGTGIVTTELLDVTKKNIINDFLYSNEVIYKAFFLQEEYSESKLNDYCCKYRALIDTNLSGNYVSQNYGNRYFSESDAKKIGFIREDLFRAYCSGLITEKEYSILLASLLYSFDKCANTVGHYEAYIKKNEISNSFIFNLIEPINTENKFEIYREDAVVLSKRVKADVAFVDPPYNSRQYSRFYHVMETITKWDKPVLSGVAMKPPVENMSDFCRSSAPLAFRDLIQNLSVKSIVVTYNNTYDSRSSSSRNKISLNQIKEILEEKGTTQIFEKDYRRFNAGKTDASNHKEIVFITNVGE